MPNTKFDAKNFNPEAFAKYIENVPNLKRNELIKSRALKNNQQIREMFSSQTGTYYGRIPLFGNIDDAPLNYDGSTDITSTTTTTFEKGVVVYGRAKAWTEKDFSYDITGGIDFMSNVAKQVSFYWESIDQDVLLSILKGIFSMTGAANLKFTDNHTYDITELTGVDAQGNPNNVVGSSTLNRAIQKACGQNKGKFTIAIMHSEVATNLENLRLLKYMTYTDKDGIQRDLSLATWNGRSVIIDDSMPVQEISPDEADPFTAYTTYILGDGAFDYENIGAKIPYEMQRDPKTNGGQDTLYTRQRKVLSPMGISFEKPANMGLSPTNDVFEAGANWTLVHDAGSGSARKYFEHQAIAIARIISRG